MEDVNEILLEETIPILCGVPYDPSIPINSSVYQIVPNIEEKIRNYINPKSLYQTLQLLITENPLNISKLSKSFSSELVKKIKTSNENELSVILGLLEQLLKIRLTTKDFTDLFHLYITSNNCNVEILSLLNSLARFGGPERYYAFPGFLTCLYKTITIGTTDNWGISLTFRSRGNGVILSIQSPSIGITITIKEGFLYIECGLNTPSLITTPNKNDLQLNNRRVVNGKWYNLIIMHSKREQRLVVEIEKENFTFSLNYPKNEEAIISIGGISSNSKSYFTGDITDVIILPEETIIRYDQKELTKDMLLFECYKISNFTPIVTIIRETPGAIINRIGGISKLFILLNQKYNTRALEDCEKILDLYFRLLSTFKMLRQESIENNEISTIFQTLINLAEITKEHTFNETKKLQTPIVKEFISFALRLINSHSFLSIRNIILRHIFDIRWWPNDSLRVEYIKELQESMSHTVLGTLPFKLFEKLSYRSLMLWILYDDIPEFEKETIPRAHLQWRCGYIQYITSIIIKDVYVVQYFMTDSLHLLDTAIQTNDFNTEALLIYMYVCMVLTSQGELKSFISTMLKKNKTALLYLYIQQNPSFLKGNIERLLALINIEVKYNVIVDAMNSTRLTPLLYQIAIECSFNNIRNTYIDTTTTGYLSSKGFLLNMNQMKLKQDFLTPFLKSISIAISNNLSNNMVVLDIILNDLVQCLENHIIWKYLLKSKYWITIFIDIAVSLVSSKEYNILQRLQNIFARIIGIAFQQQNVSLENIICYLLSKLQNKEKFYIIFRSLLKCLVKNVLCQLNNDSRDKMVIQMILLFSDFFCRTCSYGCDTALPHFEEDYELITKCLEYHHPQPKLCNSKVASMQHVFIVHLILCQLHSIALKNNNIPLLRKTLQLIPPYLVQRPQIEGYDSWVIFHLYDIVKQCNDPSVRRDISNMMYLLNLKQQPQMELDFKGIQLFGKELVSFYKTHENGLKVQADVLKVEENKPRNNPSFVFKEVQYPNLDVAPMDYNRLVMSDTDIRLRLFTSSRRNWSNAFKSNILIDIVNSNTFKFEEIGFSEVRPIIVLKPVSIDENNISIITPSSLENEYREVLEKKKGLIHFKSLTSDDGMDGVLIYLSKKEIARIYINADNLQLIIKTPSKIDEFGLNIITMVILRREEYIELYIKYHRPLLIHMKDSLKFLNNLSHITLNHQIQTVIYIDPIKAFNQSTIIKDWTNGRMSNYMFINQLNFFAGYSYNDINNHPFFPWIDTSMSWETLICHIIDRSKQNLLRNEFSLIPSPNPEVRTSVKLEPVDVCCLLYSIVPFTLLLPFYQAQTLHGKAIRSIDQLANSALVPEIYSYPLLMSLERLYILRMTLEMAVLSKELHKWLLKAFSILNGLPKKKYEYDFSGIFLNQEGIKINVLPTNNGTALTVGEEGFSVKSNNSGFNEISVFMRSCKMKKVEGLNNIDVIYDGNEMIIIESLNGKTLIKQKGSVVDVNGKILSIIDSKKGTIEYVLKNSIGVEWKYYNNNHQNTILKIEEIQPIQNAFISSKKCIVLFTENSFYCKSICGTTIYTKLFIPHLFSLSANGFSYYVYQNTLHVETLNGIHKEIQLNLDYISMTTLTCLFLDFIILTQPNQITTYVFLGDRFVLLDSIPFVDGWTIISVQSNCLINDDPTNWTFVVNCEKDNANSFVVYSLNYITLKSN
ncbi:hypothetical protein ENUP19_0061G0085 [Entamoeba nuttalli]|uniref:BEACH domain-containing protein n=2 Tax=Entamoeba nuttalli TaxID=412467 RepID=K2HPL8_ENTNP|nr:hypothetical protein ENU1_184010 [Entamoeba nuttalli P19]EKE37845.1 hypothetical protein ENU1_184010 [Entamoeba nuttalli P19]|eukprot:XP_008859817.1 hypothetical protein ENU1_184010 [Entamoeba nuttalli P19]